MSTQSLERQSASKRQCFVGGTVYTPEGPLRTDILVQDGIIVALGDKSAFALDDRDELINCKNRLILPGLIDAHCHIQLDTGIFKTSDNWWIGSREAARGGITTVIDFVGPEPGQDLHDALVFRQKQAESSLIDYTFHMTVLDASEQTLASIDKCPAWGISSLKIYTTYRPNYYLDDNTIVDVLERARKNNMTVLVHCENDAIVSHETAKTGSQTESTWRVYPEMRPWQAEAEAASRVIALANYTDAKVVIAHNSCPETLRIVQNAKKSNPNIFNETAPQYLFLSSRCNHEETQAWRYILQPPLRDQALADEMRDMMRNDAADMFITDHCAYTAKEKMYSGNATPGGLPGLETLFHVLAGGLDIPLESLLRKLSENPAKIYGLWPHKGAIAPGFDADLLIVEDDYFFINEEKLKSFAGYSPFHGKRARYIIHRVFRRGEEIIRNGEILGQKGSGRFLNAATQCE